MYWKLPVEEGRWIQEGPGAQRRNREQIREMSGLVGHIRAHAGRQKEFNNHRLFACGCLCLCVCVLE